MDESLTEPPSEKATRTCSIWGFQSSFPPPPPCRMTLFERRRQRHCRLPVAEDDAEGGNGRCQDAVDPDDDAGAIEDLVCQPEDGEADPHGSRKQHREDDAQALRTEAGQERKDGTRGEGSPTSAQTTRCQSDVQTTSPSPSLKGEQTFGRQPHTLPCLSIDTSCASRNEWNDHRELQ